jgi:hypothetical protein
MTLHELDLKDDIPALYTAQVNAESLKELCQELMDEIDSFLVSLRMFREARNNALGNAEQNDSL